MKTKKQFAMPLVAAVVMIMSVFSFNRVEANKDPGGNGKDGSCYECWTGGVAIQCWEGGYYCVPSSCNSGFC